MGALDTFYLLFESRGAEKLKKTQEEINKQTNNIESDFKKTGRTSESLSDSLATLSTKFTKLFATAAGAHAIFSGIKSSINYAVDLDYASRSLGVNVEELDAWGNAVQRTGGTAQDFQQSLSNLSRTMWLSGQDALTVLPRIADSMQKMGRSAAIAWGQTLGLSLPVINLLRMGRKEVESVIKRQYELGVVTKKDAEEARKFQIAWQESTHSLRTNFMAASMQILPALDKILEKFTELAQWFNENPRSMEAALYGVAAALSVVTLRILAANAALLKNPAVLAGMAVYGAFKVKEAHNVFTREESPNWAKWVADKYDAIRTNMKYRNFPEGANPLALKLPEKLGGMRSYMQSMDSAPFGRSSLGSTNNNNKNFTFNVGDITINTQATDGKQVGIDFQKFLVDHFRQSINNFDDGLQI